MKNSSSGSYCFCRDFTCFIVWKFLDPYDLYLYCGGWVLVVVLVVVGRNLAYALLEPRASAKFPMGTQNHEISHPYSFILTESLGGD